MKPTDDLQTDGGELRLEDLQLDETQRESENRWVTYRRFADEYVKAPFLILWSDWRSRAGIVIIMMYVLAAVVGTQIIPTPYPNQAELWIKPFQSWQYLLGTDKTGQDLLGLMVHATPSMLIMITAGAVFSTVVAAVVGTVSGYKGGTMDRVLMIITDSMIAIPGLALVIVLAAIIEPRSPVLVGIILSSHVWAGLARSLRSQVLTLREDSYVEASRVMGIRTPAIIGKDVLPNLMPYILINFVNSARNVIFNSVGLYFLGVLPYTNLNWGVVLNQSYNSPAIHSFELMYYLFVPLVTVIMISFGLILLSQGFDRIFNPRIRAKHTKSGGKESVGAEPDEGSTSVNTTMGQ
ncbi:ABC transporter permease [Halomontanus rarus]|uniref:ABC transporter permease n=1 Tax=Halomontanus rarus TaxID=3034020 RepID=UPI0023E884B1|nr:ABC transporter permease [Halovivax sp. TS33]